MKTKSIQPEYVEFIPRELQQGILYISTRFGTASHLCCCGCGTKIVTPLRPTEYSIKERHGRVTLRPSIGSWDHPCESHYFITDDRIVWAAKMSAAQIRRGREYDDQMKDAYFAKFTQPWWRTALDRVKDWLCGLFG